MDVISEIRTDRVAHCGMKGTHTLQALEEVRHDSPESSCHQSSPRSSTRKITITTHAHSELEREAETKLGGESGMEIESLPETKFGKAFAVEIESLAKTKFAEVQAQPETDLGEAFDMEIEASPEVTFGVSSTNETEPLLEMKAVGGSVTEREVPSVTTFEDFSLKEIETTLATKFGGASVRLMEAPSEMKFGEFSTTELDAPFARTSGAASAMEVEVPSVKLPSSLIVSRDSKGILGEAEQEEKEMENPLIVSEKSKERVSKDPDKKQENDEPLGQSLPQIDLNINTEGKGDIGEASSSESRDSKLILMKGSSSTTVGSNLALKRESSSASLDSKLRPKKQSSSLSLDSKLTPSMIRRRNRVSVTVLERMQQDPLLAEHFAQLETPTAELCSDSTSHGFEPRRSLKSTSRLKCTTDSVGIKYVNQYVVIKVLGRGTFGKVKLCLNTMDCKLYAVKILKRKWVARLSIGGTRDDVGKGAMREIAIMKKLNHPNVVALIEVIDDPSNRKLYLVLEYVDGGPIMVNDLWHPIPEDKARLYFRDTCQGLDYLHFNKIVHRDLKPGNLLQTMDGRIKISDFGVSHVLDHESDSIHGAAGTPAFLAPEICSGGECQGRAADIWALGVCLYVMVCGEIPFPAETVVDMYKSIIDKKTSTVVENALGPMWHRSPSNVHGSINHSKHQQNTIASSFRLIQTNDSDDFVIFREPQLAFPSKLKLSRSLRDLLSLILTKDPASRIPLASIMHHDWVSNQGGAEPLLPFKLQKTRVSTPMAVSEAEVKAAINVKQFGLPSLSNVEPVEKHFEPGEYIMRQGEEGQEMYLINSGECEVLVESRSLTQPSRGRMEYAIAERGPGQYIGEMALNTDTTNKPPKRTASIRAKTHVVTLVVSRDQVMEALSKNSEAAKNIADTITERDREMRRRMKALELRLPSFRPPSFRHTSEQEHTKVAVLEQSMPSSSPESDEDVSKRASVCLGCRIL